MKRGTDRLLKFSILKRTLSLCLWQTKGLLGSIWDFTAENSPRGDIGRFTDDEIAFGIEWSSDSRTLIEALVTSRWLDRNQSHRLIVHDWYDHCEDSVHIRLARMGALFADGRIPKLTSFNQAERERISSVYRQMACAGTNARAVGVDLPVGAPAPLPLPEPLPIPGPGPERARDSPTPDFCASVLKFANGSGMPLWFAEWCARHAIRFPDHFRWPECPAEMADWWKTFRDCTEKQLDEASLWLAELPDEKKPKRRQDHRAAIKRRAVQRKPVPAVATGTVWG